MSVHLNAKQRMVLASIQSGAGAIWNETLTVNALLRRGLIVRVKDARSYDRWEVTDAGADALAEPSEPRSVGRPRVHADSAGKQWAYRKRVEAERQALEDAAAVLHRETKSPDNFAPWLAGETPAETLRNVTDWLRSHGLGCQTDLARSGTDSPSFVNL